MAAEDAIAVSAQKGDRETVCRSGERLVATAVSAVVVAAAIVDVSVVAADSVGAMGR